MKKTIPCITASKRMKYIGKKLTKEVHDSYTKNYKMLFKEIQADLNKWKDMFCSQIRR